VKPPYRQQRILLVLTLVLFTGVGSAGATGNRQVASLKVSVPASMARGSVLKVTARGYSGRFDAVSWSSVKGGSSVCASPNTSAISIQAVPRNRKFNVKFTNIFGAPGTLTVCVYLFTSGPHANDTKGHYIVKSKRVKVS
jgi:hypothetical protein